MNRPMISAKAVTLVAKDGSVTTPFHSTGSPMVEFRTREQITTMNGTPLQERSKIQQTLSSAAHAMASRVLVPHLFGSFCVMQGT